MQDCAYTECSPPPGHQEHNEKVERMECQQIIIGRYHRVLREEGQVTQETSSKASHEVDRAFDNSCDRLSAVAIDEDDDRNKKEESEDDLWVRQAKSSWSDGMRLTIGYCLLNRAYPIIPFGRCSYREVGE